MEAQPAHRFFQLGAATALLVCAGPISVAQTVTNTEVYNLASQVAEEIEYIREVMGRPFDDSPRLPVGDVSQLQVYYQAQTLFRKANQLAQEYAGTPRTGAPPVPNADVQASDSFSVVISAQEQVRQVSRAFGIGTEAQIQERTTASTTGVFLTILDANRQLNLLINEPILPSDVFDQVTLAVLYSAALLAHQGAENPVPEAEPFDGYKRPSDVYALLLNNTDLMSEVAEAAGISVLTLSSRRNIPDDVEPGHVYDIARILVAGLALVANAMDVEDVFPDLERPELIFPTQVYARATVLQQQLEQIGSLL